MRAGRSDGAGHDGCLPPQAREGARRDAVPVSALRSGPCHRTQSRGISRGQGVAPVPVGIHLPNRSPTLILGTSSRRLPPATSRFPGGVSTDEGLPSDFAGLLCTFMAPTRAPGHVGEWASAERRGWVQGLPVAVTVQTIDPGDAPAWSAIVLSLAFSLAALVVSLRGLKWQRLAAQAAIRSANADEKAMALAELAAATPRHVESHAGQRQHITWELERRKHRFILRNTGSEIATGVTVDGAGVAEVATQLPVNAAVRPGASVSFMMAGSMAHRLPDEIQVSWDGHPEPLILPVSD
jgi:hypothetical protein